MNSFVLAYRSLIKKGQNNITKIICLGAGLAIGLILVSKVIFDNSFDNFFPDNERIYQIQSNVTQNEEPPAEWGQVSGAIAPGMQREVPGVEIATRFTSIGREAIFYTKDKNSYKGNFILADNNLFDILPRPMISGDAKDILSKPMYALISDGIAEKIGGDVIGKIIALDSYPGKEITIGGIFKKLPQNSHLDYDVIISLASISNFTWDGSQNWLGNDRYKAYVKLNPGTNPDQLTAAIRQMQEKYQDIQSVEATGTSLWYTLMPITKIHSDTQEAKRMTILLAAISFALLFTAVMNYILLVISTYLNRAKPIAVYKCYGAKEKDIAKMIFTEAFFHLILALVISVLIIFCFRGTVEEVLSASVYSLFTARTSLFLLIICGFILFIVGLVPSYIFSNVPVASVFRTLRFTRRRWKLVLLFVQLVATAFLVNLLVIVSRQYDYMSNDNPGYVYENVLYCVLTGVDAPQRQKIIDELNRLPKVEKVATSSTLPFRGQSGNNVRLPNEEERGDLFNIADLYYSDENYFSLLEIPIIEGKNFDKETSTSNDIIISKKFANKIAEMAGWKDGVIGKELIVSEHYNGKLNQIIGVYSDIRIGSITDEDKRPSAIFYAQNPASCILIKMHELNSENIQTVYDIFKTALPDKDISIIPYKNSIVKLYDGSRMFTKTITIGGIVTLIITLIGLIGYTVNEVMRRRSEIAIRKVNGASLLSIVLLFLKDNLWVSIPAMVCGGIAAAIAALKWMENFSEKIELTPLLFILCGFAVLIIVLAVVVINCIKVANQNPVETLKNN